jgi:uncharacterized membrane protein required for colicin V production
MYIDLLFLTVIIFFGIVGYIRGFLNQLLSVLLILAILLFAQPLADWLKFDSGYRWTQKAPLMMLWALSAFSFFLAFLGLGALIRAIRKTEGLMPFDHWMGLGFGFVKGFMIALIMGVLFLTLPDSSRAQFADLNRDARDSVMMSASAKVMGWESLSSFKSLKGIQSKLQPEEVELEEVGRKLFDAPADQPRETSEVDSPSRTTQRPTPWKGQSNRRND